MLIDFISKHCVEALVFAVGLLAVKKIGTAIVKVLFFGVVCYFVFTYGPELLNMIRR